MMQTCDGVPTNEDCDDTNLVTITDNDADCDGVPTNEDCDDTNAMATNLQNDAVTDGFRLMRTAMTQMN